MISMTSWKNRLRRMLFLDELEPLVDQTPKVADFGANSATAERELHKWLAGTSDDNAGDQEPSVLETSRSNVSIRTAAAGIANST